MDDQRRSRPENDETADPTEGVRIIGPDEAAEAIERGDVAPRRTDDQPRFGDRPPAPPAGPRPALRFPLDASADPTRIERPPVQPAPDPVTGPVELPHWTEPPTGEVPAVLIGDDSPLMGDGGDDLDAWSSFATSTPRWRDADDDWGDDGFMEHLAGDSDDVRVGALGDQDSEPSHEEYFSFDDLHERVEERTADVSDASVPAAAIDPGAPWASDDWHASAVAEGEDPAADEGFADDDEFDEVDDQNVITGGSGGRRGGYDPGDAGGPAMVGGSTGDRDLPTAVAVGVGLFVVAAIALKLGPGFAVALVALALGAAAAEFFNVLDTVGWASAKFVGIVTCFLFPIAVFWRGEIAYPLITFLLIAAVLSWYLVGAGGPDPRVLEGSGATVLGVMWIGGLGSTAAAMLDLHDGRALFLIAIIATVGYDVGAYFIGKAAGHRPLSTASPNKTVEGLVGGMAVALFLTIILVGALKLGPWDGPAAALVLGIGAACAAPLGDLCQSLLKRDLGVKDMSSFIPGHGGVLDRFDSMLFVLPTVFLLYVTLGH